MKDQNYENHRRYYAPHHFIFYPVLLILIAVSFRAGLVYPDRSLEFWLISAVFLMVGWLSFMLRQHYALGNQNRIIRLELRLRYFQLTGNSFESLEEQLSFGQMAALRFASDEQFPNLIEHAISKKLSPDSIKKAIQKWVPDHMRL